MNLEEGELRPQLADRFAHHIHLDGIPTVLSGGYLEHHVAWRPDQATADGALREKVLAAKANLDQVQTAGAILDNISARCDAANLAGHRRALAVWRSARPWRHSMDLITLTKVF